MLVSSIDMSTNTVTVDMTGEQMEELIEGLRYLLAGGKTIYLQDEGVIVQLRKKGDDDD